MSALADHLNLFKADWIADPALLADRIREASVSDRFTAELAAWCAEIHEHLRELADELDIGLILMGGNGTSLRFDAIRQRGSRDNDYLTAATPEDIDRLIARLGARFAPLGDLIQPYRHQPKKPVRDLPLATYDVRVPLLLDHGYSSNNVIKLEFHFEQELPASELVTGALGPAATPEMTATLPQLPYQIAIKLMTLTGDPVGIDESTRAAAVPRQMYDIDLLLTGLAEEDWATLADYYRARYAEECVRAEVAVSPEEPYAGIRERLERWGDCLDETADPWQSIRAAQQSGLQRAVHLRPWGWRARAYRLIALATALALGADGWTAWEAANALADLVPTTKAKPFRARVAELAGADVRTLPVELHDFTWTALVPTDPDRLTEHLERARTILLAG